MKNKIIKNIYKELNKNNSFFDVEINEIMKIVERELLLYEFKQTRLEKFKSKVSLCWERFQKFLKKLKKVGLDFGAKSIGFIKKKKKSEK